MGRQQKKKDPSKKKKKRQAPAATGSAAVKENKTGMTVRAKSMAGAPARNKSKPAAPSARNGKPVAATGIRAQIEQALQFLREVRSELKKVNWPSRKQVIGSTAVVLVMVLLVSFFLGVVDFGLSSIVQFIIG